VSFVVVVIVIIVFFYGLRPWSTSLFPGSFPENSLLGPQRRISLLWPLLPRQLPGFL
jgi:hypothetical protein